MGPRVRRRGDPPLLSGVSAGDRGSCMAGQSPSAAQFFDDDVVTLGRVEKPHGVRGAVRVRPYGDPESLAAYGPVTLPGGRRAGVRVLSTGRGTALCAIEGVADRDAAEALRGVHLAIPRSALPIPEDGSFYHADLVGLSAYDPGGEEWGRVIAVHNFGAGDIVEIQPVQGASVLIPFTRESVPEVNLEIRRLVVASHWRISVEMKRKGLLMSHAGK